MELGSKVTAMEEEIAILKGEIKTILQEVRTAVLARENPFAVDAQEHLQIPALPETSPAVVASTPELEPSLIPPAAPESPPRVVQLHALPETEATGERSDFEPQSWKETPADRTNQDREPGRRRWSVGSLATLIAWTQETANRMDASDMDIVLSLACYGGLIDDELVSTLTKLSSPLIDKDAPPRQKGVTDYLLALRELSALIEEAENTYRGSGPLRKAS